MKKATRFLAVLLALIMIIALSSCSWKTPVSKKPTPSKKPTAEGLETAMLAKNIMSQMNACDSFQMDAVTTVKCFENGVAVENKSVNKEIRTGLLSDDFQIYMSLEREDAAGMRVTDYSEGYCDGKYFVKAEGDYYDQKLYSKLTADEAREHSAQFLLRLGAFFECDNIKASKNEDGTTTFSLSGYHPYIIDAFCIYFDVYALASNNDLIDAEVLLKADESNRLTEITIDFIFRKTFKPEETPTASVDIRYSQYNEAYIDPNEIDLTECSEVCDLRMLDNIYYMIEDLFNSNDGRFNFSFREITELMGETTSYEEDSRVSYGQKNGGFLYDIDAKINGVQYSITYSKGKYSIISKSSDYAEKKSLSDQEAREQIWSYINAAGFDAALVVDIQEISENVYQFSCDNSPFFSNVYDNTEVEDVKQTIQFTIKNGKIVKIVGKVSVTGTYFDNSGSHPITVTTYSTVDFEMQSNGGV